jgi:hypothetical protein
VAGATGGCEPDGAQAAAASAPQSQSLAIRTQESAPLERSITSVSVRSGLDMCSEELYRRTGLSDPRDRKICSRPARASRPGESLARSSARYQQWRSR